MINTALSPNTQVDDFKVALSALFNPARMCEGNAGKKLKSWFKDFFQAKYVSTFDSARSAIFFALQEMGIGDGDEVIVQSFTCVAAVNPIKWTGAQPVFIDIDKGNFNANLDDLENKITEKTKAILVQHTFGYPADMERIMQIVHKKDILVIEDCTHTIGTEFNGNKLGVIGDIGIFSLGRDKAVSASFGGVAVTNKKHLGKKMEGVEEFLSYPSKRWIIKQILFTITTFLSVRYYDTFSIGKVIHFLSKKFTQRESTTKDEKECGSMPSHARSKLPNAFAKIANSQLQKIEELNKHRHKLAILYLKQIERLKLEGVIVPEWKISKDFYPIRFPLLVKERDELLLFAQKRGIYLGDWYDVPIAPKGVDHKEAGYMSGSCPRAEDVCKRVLNLPLHVNLSEEDALKVVHTIKDFYE